MKRKLLWAMVLVLSTFGLVQAQETTSGSLTGQVTDAQGAPVPGATVTLTSGQGNKTFTTDADGKFFAPYLTPGRYDVRVELSGFSPVEQKNIDVRLGQRLDVSGLVLKVGGLEEVVEVVGSAPVVDTTSTTTGGTLDSESMKHLPVGRNFTESLYLIPGVSNSGVGRANPSLGGASGLENSYVVDGVNITNSGYGAIGSYSINFGSLGTGVTTDFIKETQVKTGGFEAEYGQATGGVVNVVTQSGTNLFHGSVFGYSRPQSLESDSRLETTVNGTVNTTHTQQSDVGFTLGGPLMKDKVFFFGAFNPQWQRATFIAPPGFALESLGEVNRNRRILSYAGKLTWQAGGNHRFDFSAFGDPAHGENGPQRQTSLLRTDTAGFSELKKYGGHNQVLKYDGIISRNWLIEASAARAENEITEVPSVNTAAVRDARVVPNIFSGGIGNYEQGNHGVNKQYSLKSTNIFEAAGNHQVRYGVLYEDIKYNNISQRTGATFTLPNGVQTKTGAAITIYNDDNFGEIYRVTRANYENVRATTQHYLSFFAQDTWQVGKKLTLRPGLRYEQQKLVGTLADHTFSGNYAPRIGATYDLKGNGKSKIYASWGRFYSKIPNDLAARALSADAGISRADYFDAALTRPIPEGVATTGGGAATRHFILAGTAASTIDPTTKSSYQDEILGGVEVQAFGNMNLGARYIHRNMPRILEDVGTAAMVLYDLGDPALGSVEYFLTNPRDNYPATLHGVGAFENPVHKYDAVELTANKTFSQKYSLLASYRWSRLKGNFEGFFRNDNGQSDPAISSLEDFPTNDPSYTQIGAPQFGYKGDIRYLGCSLGCGVLPNDRTHQVKIYGSTSFSSFNVGVGINAGSGLPLTPLAASPNYQSGGEIPEAIRGSGIQTRDDGFRKRTKPEIQADVHADYTMKMGERRFILSADAFNITNRQEATNYDNWTESVFGAPNPDYGAPSFAGGSAFSGYQAPRQIRVGARFEW